MGVIQSSNHQKLTEENILSKGDLMMFIKHVCILNNNEVCLSSPHTPQYKLRGLNQFGLEF